MLGLVGIGRIASRVAVVMPTLGMTVIASDPAVLEPPVPGVEMVPFDHLLATADVVSVHAPALPSTYRMFDAGAFERMKPGAYFVNCARGVLVDHGALLAAIDSGRLVARGSTSPIPSRCPPGIPCSTGRTSWSRRTSPPPAWPAGAGSTSTRSTTLAVLEGKPATTVV